MKNAGLLLASLIAGLAPARPHDDRIEAIGRTPSARILYSADAPPGYVFGRWTVLDQNQTLGRRLRAP